MACLSSACSKLMFPPAQGIIGMSFGHIFLILKDLNTLSGLPYAISRAGFFTGIFLLVVLCCVTDWTIRLIVTNAKLSGTNSYIGIMNRCFGSSGRAAVSFFQFSFAFGGASVKPTILSTRTLYSFTARNVRLWDHHRCVYIAFGPSPPRNPVFIPLQGTRSHTSSAPYFLTFIPCLSYPSSPTVDSSSPFAPFASHTHYHCTATSTNSPSRPASRSVGCSSSWAPSCSKARTYRPP